LPSEIACSVDIETNEDFMCKILLKRAIIMDLGETILSSGKRQRMESYDLRLEIFATFLVRRHIRCALSLNARNLWRWWMSVYAFYASAYWLDALHANLRVVRRGPLRWRRLNSRPSPSPAYLPSFTFNYYNYPSDRGFHLTTCFVMRFLFTSLWTRLHYPDFKRGVLSPLLCIVVWIFQHCLSSRSQAEQAKNPTLLSLLCLFFPKLCKRVYK